MNLNPLLIYYYKPISRNDAAVSLSYNLLKNDNVFGINNEFFNVLFNIDFLDLIIYVEFNEDFYY